VALSNELTFSQSAPRPHGEILRRILRALEVIEEDLRRLQREVEHLKHPPEP